jgi:hypothetical protein
MLQLSSSFRHLINSFYIHWLAHLKLKIVHHFLKYLLNTKQLDINFIVKYKNPYFQKKTSQNFFLPDWMRSQISYNVLIIRFHFLNQQKEMKSQTNNLQHQPTQSAAEYKLLELKFEIWMKAVKLWKLMRMICELKKRWFHLRFT